MTILFVLTTFGIAVAAVHINFLPLEQYHIVNCVVNVTYQYLALGKSLLVSWSRASRSDDKTGHSLPPRGDVTDILRTFMETLNQEFILPVEISSPGQKSTEFQLYDFGKHHAYIFFVWGQEKFDVVGSLREQLEELEDSGSWNPRARFFIVVTEQSPQDTQLMAQAIAEVLYKGYGAMDVLILIPGTTEKAVGCDTIPGTTEKAVGCDIIPRTSEKAVGCDIIPGTTEKAVGCDIIPGTTEKAVGCDIIPGTTEKAVGCDIIPRTSEKAVGSDTISGKSRKLDGCDIVPGTRVKTDVLNLTIPFDLYTCFREASIKTRGSRATSGTGAVADGPALISEWRMKTGGHVTTTAFNLYTWLPYQSNVKCVEISVLLLDKWILDDDGTFFKQAQLFPDKFPRNLHGCPLRVRPNLVPPVYVDLTGNYTDDEGSIIYNYTGLEVQYMTLLAQMLNANIVYSPAVTEDSVEARVQSFIDLREGLIDVAFGGMPLHPLGLEFADPTIPYFSDILKWYVPCGKPVPRMEKVATIFSSTLCIATVIVFLSSVVVFWMLSKRADAFGLQESATYKQISRCFYAMWAIALCMSVPQQPRSPFSRAVFLVLVWYFFIITTLFQSLFTSIIVDPGMTEQLKTLEELLQSDYTYVYNEYFDSFVRQSSPSYYSEINLKKEECKYKLDCQTDFLSNDNIATTGFYIYTDYYVMAALPSGSPSPKLCFLDDNIFLLHFSLYLSKGSPLTKSLNTAIFRAIENGFIVKIAEDFKEVCRFNEQQHINIDYTDVKEDTNEVFVFTVQHLLVSFCFLGVGCSIALLVLLAELLLQRIYQVKSNGSSNVLF